MDSGDSGSICSSGDDLEYDSGAGHAHHHTQTFLNHPIPTHFITSHVSSSESDHHPSLFDLPPTYFHALNSSHNSFLNLDTYPIHASLGPTTDDRSTDPSLQLLINNENERVPVPPPPTISSTNNVVQNTNPKKRSRASRRAPTTVLTTDTTNFRSMVQEFTGIPPSPFSSSTPTYSTRRLHLLSSLYDTTSTLGAPLNYPMRPSPQKLLLSSSSSSSSPSPYNNVVDAIASTTTNISSSASATANSISHQLLPPPGLGLPHHHPENIMPSIQNHHPIPTFHIPSGFRARSSLEVLDMNHAHLVAPTAAASAPSSGHVIASPETCSLRNASNDQYGCGDGSTRDPLRSLQGSYGKVVASTMTKP